ncbi:MAG: polysaccharide biosynthesis protein, partial [Clostridia bacterium]|nr:polysaccharide biosynthesis protein [Clostridia bacterium]
MHLKVNRKVLLWIIDSFIFIAVYGVVILVHIFGNYFSIPELYLLYFLLLASTISLSRLLFRVYDNVWRYANARAYLIMIVADAVGGFCGLLISRLIALSNGWRVLSVWQFCALVAVFCLSTLSIRFLYQFRYRYANASPKTIHKIGVAIVGAGFTGALLCEDLLYNADSHYNPICFIDCDEQKIGKSICGVRVLPESDTVVDELKAMPVQEIFIAMHDLSSQKLRILFDFYRPTGCKIKLFDFPMTDGETTGDAPLARRQIREIHIEDLLFRDSLHFDEKESEQFYRDKVVLVTGGGGSIGSELCRQIAAAKPKRLIVFDIYENSAYDLQQELIRKYGDKLDLCVEIGSVRDTKRLSALFAYYRPQIVFHAAAHKHVPLMEQSGVEAIKNNILGTYKTANAAEKYGTEKFILISTDKAVNPTNIMGASKRLCEMVIQCRQNSKTSFSAVRFGNVLGSNGSVIPIFKRQIAAGGPVTLTDKRIIRYFMTIPEAVQLVMQTGIMAKSGELFVLDMGKPIRILDLA